VRLSPVSWVEGCSQAFGIRQPGAVQEVWGATQVAAVIYPDSIGSAWGVASYDAEAHGTPVAYVFGVAQALAYQSAGAVAEVIAVAAQAVELQPDTAGFVEGAIAVVGIADRFPVSWAIAVESAAGPAFRSAVAIASRVADRYRIEPYGAVAQVEGPAIPPAKVPELAVAQVEGVTQFPIATARGLVAQVEGPAAVFSQTTVQRVAGVEGVAGPARSPIAGVAAGVEGIAQRFAFRQSIGVAQAEGPTLTWNVRWPLYVGAVEGARGGIKYSPVTRVGFATAVLSVGKPVWIGKSSTAWAVSSSVSNPPAGRAAIAWALAAGVVVRRGSPAITAFGCKAIVAQAGPVELGELGELGADAGE
jgi:hypothetical protein